MNEIALPAFHVTTTSTCPVKIDYRLGQDLRLYRQYYKQAYGAEVTEADLIREMTRRFMESDPQFQIFKNRQTAVVGRRGPKSAVPTTPQKVLQTNGVPVTSAN